MVRHICIRCITLSSGSLLIAIVAVVVNPIVNIGDKDSVAVASMGY